MILIVVIIIIFFYVDNRSFKKSGYAQVSKNRYFQVRSDKGLYGEYLIYNKLSKVKGYKKIVVNTYLPKRNGHQTEIDLLLIHETGIYCIESKNYGGWIYGNERAQYWTQMLKGRKKYKFYNPMMQNKGHIRAVKDYLRAYDTGDIYSVIVFSDRCTLKKIDLESEDVLLYKSGDLPYRLNKVMRKRARILDRDQIEKLYGALMLRSNVSKREKKQHIKNVKRRWR